MIKSLRTEECKWFSVIAFHCSVDDIVSVAKKLANIGNIFCFEKMIGSMCLFCKI